MKSYRTFLRQILAELPPPAPERIPVTGALGRALCADLVARVADPAERRSVMDGYAVRAADLRGAGPRTPVTLRAVGLSPAGFTKDLRLGKGEAHRIMTGAPLPRNANAVVPVERIQLAGDQVRFTTSPSAGTFVRQAGENFRAGDILVTRGSVLRAQEIGLAITAGIRQVTVGARLRVGVLATGNELVPAGRRLRRGEVYDSNRPMVLALVAATGAIPVDLGRVADEPRELLRLVKRAQRQTDFLITIGGVSMGDFDVVKQAVRSRRTMALVKIAMRPAKPQAFGRFGRLFWYGLPGNPVSAWVAFDRLVRPLLLRGMGQRQIFRAARSGTCHSHLVKPRGVREFVRACAWQTKNGWQLRKVRPEGSSNLRSAVQANALMVLPEETLRVRAGTAVSFELLADGPAREMP